MSMSCASPAMPGRFQSATAGPQLLRRLSQPVAVFQPTHLAAAQISGPVLPQAGPVFLRTVDFRLRKMRAMMSRGDAVTDTGPLAPQIRARLLR
jgi:hypothetical protein